MMHEMLVPADTLMGAVKKVFKMAKEYGYIRTKIVSDILKPVSVSDDLAISELTWWYYAELEEKIENSGMSIDKPGHIIVRFPQYHTRPKI